MNDHAYAPPAPRSPYCALRAWEPLRDESARARALARLELHLERSGPLRRRPRLRLPRRWIAPAVALAVVAGGGGAVAAVLLRTEHTNRLAVFTARGTLAPQFRVGARGSGHCWEASLAAEVPGAYRCFEGNAIHDPCFAASAHARTVACFVDPWHAVTVLRLTHRLSRLRPLPHGSRLPWAIVTADGRRCAFMTGATALVGNERINYGCTDGSYLIGAPDRRSPLWTIRSVRHFRLADMHIPLSHFPPVGIRQTIG